MNELLAGAISVCGPKYYGGSTSCAMVVIMDDGPVEVDFEVSVVVGTNEMLSVPVWHADEGASIDWRGGNKLCSVQVASRAM